MQWKRHSMERKNSLSSQKICVQVQGFLWLMTMTFAFLNFLILKMKEVLIFYVMMIKCDDTVLVIVWIKEPETYLLTQIKQGYILKLQGN